MKSKTVHSAMFGLAVGDALGVPAEFKSRAYLGQNPVNDMKGYGTHNQLAGTWSDDSALTFCLAESLCSGYHLQDIAQKFLEWYRAELWTPHGEVFDVGIATSKAISKIASGTDAVLCGGDQENDNGNGSLMRILPLVFYLQNEADLQVIFNKVKEVSSITHAHFRSVFACFIYIIYALELLKGRDKVIGYQNMQSSINRFIDANDFDQNEIRQFERILSKNISDFQVNEIFSSGYVVHSLEASLWCIQTSANYVETVLRAVNLGEDTDTTAAIAGGLAGLIYGIDAIPEKWKNVLVRKADIEALCEKMENKYVNHQRYTVAELISEKENKEFFFFWGHQPSKDGMLSKSCLSQWWPSPFVENNITYQTAEHYMMANKAALFNDQVTLDRILASESPEEVKKLGREVKNYDETIWSKHRYEIVKKGNFHKFSQNELLGAFLIDTGDKILAEASPVDHIWGIGWAEDDENAKIPGTWKGLNLLGFALMKVRDEIAALHNTNVER